MVYRVPAEMLDTTDFLNMENHQLVCTHGEICDIYFRKEVEYEKIQCYAKHSFIGGY